MIATKRAQVTLEKLGELSALANSKDLYGKPYVFHGPVYVVANAAERLRCTHASPGGYVVQMDEKKVYQSAGLGWALPAIRVVESFIPSGGGAAGEQLVRVDGGTIGTMYVWRPGSSDGRFAAGWYPADVRGVIESMRLAILSRQGGFPYQTYVKNEHYVFTYEGQNSFAAVMPWITEVARQRVSLEGQPLQEVLRAHPVLANISYISTTPVRVEAQAVGAITAWPHFNAGTGAGDRKRATIKFRLKHSGLYAGRLTGSFTIQGVYRLLTDAGEPTFRITGASVGVTQVLTHQDRSGSRNYTLTVTIDGGWSGAEETWSIELIVPWDMNGPAYQGMHVSPTNPEMVFRVTGAAPVASENTFGAEGFEAMARGIPDTTSADIAAREGPMFQEKLPDELAGLFGFEFAEADGWRSRGRLGAVVAEAMGGIWRAIPLSILNGAATDPTMLVDYQRSYFAPERREPVASEDGSVMVASAVDGVIARYPVLKTTDVPNRKVVQINGDPLTNFPAGGTIYCLSVHRVRELMDGGLQVRVGYVTEAGAFKAMRTLMIAPGVRDSERVYPGWVVLNGITMAYECSEPVNVQAVWVAGERYSNPNDPGGLGVILPDVFDYQLKGKAMLSAHLFNDVEAVLNALP